MNVLYSSSFNLLTEPKFGRAKRIRVWANGESRCYEISINPKNFRSWTAILLHVTDVIQPTFGAVRKLLALSRKQIVDSFEDLNSSEKYIALGTNCKFKQPLAGYNITEKESFLRKRSVKKFYTGDINSRTEPFLMETKRKKLTIVYITVNGRGSQNPQKVVLNEKDMKDWVIIYNYLTNILDIPEGIKHICTIFGQVLKKPCEFQHGYLYVAVPFKDSFVMMDYVRCLTDKSKYRNSYTLAIRANSGSSLAKIENRPKSEDESVTISTYRNQSSFKTASSDFTEDRQSISTV